MNYIYELNAFWKFVETNPLDCLTMFLYLRILHFHNTSGWKKTIKLENKMLAAILGISEKTLIKHRNVLIEVGLLKYTSRQRVKRSGEYTLLSFERGEVGKIKSAEQTAVTNTPVCSAEDNMTEKITADTTIEFSADCSDIYKQDETKSIVNIEKDSKELEFLLTICVQYDIDVNDHTKKWLLGLMEEFKVLWIQQAIHEASIKNKVSEKYIYGILINWQKAGKVTTLITVNKDNKKSPNYKQTSKNRFHNFEQHSDNYSPEEINKIAEMKRKEHSERIKKLKEGDNVAS